MRKREIQINIRLSSREYEHLQKLEQISGLPRSALLRRLIQGQEIRARPTEETAKLMQEVSRIGNNINQIARVANSLAYLSPEDIEEIQEMQRRIWNKIRDL